MGVSLHAQSVVLLCLLVAGAASVIGQVAIQRAWPTSASVTGGRWSRPGVEWAAMPATFAGVLAGVLTLGPLLLLGPIPAALAVPWLIIWGLGPCVVLGYLSGRWWSFVGATPILVLWPLGVMFGSKTDATLNADLFSTLPLTAAIALLLSLGSAAHSGRNRRRPVPEASQADITATSPVAAPPPSEQPPFWPPPPGWKPTPTQADEQSSAPEPLPGQPPFWPPPPGWKPTPTQADRREPAVPAASHQADT